MKRATIYKIFITLALAIGLALVLFFYFNQQENIIPDEPVAVVSESAQSSFVSSQAESFESVAPLDVPPEEDFLQTIHEMSHQKVEATRKWGATEMTEERIETLLAILSQADYKQKAFYHNTLTSWAEGDFSNAVDVHNTIWEWQGGNVGRAERLLTPEEEQAYIEKYFR